MQKELNGSFGMWKFKILGSALGGGWCREAHPDKYKIKYLACLILNYLKPWFTNTPFEQQNHPVSLQGSFAGSLAPNVDNSMAVCSCTTSVHVTWLTISGWGMWAILNQFL
jgi:hypothetical protein